MSDLPDGVYGLDARGTVSSEDYGRVFAPLVDELWRGDKRLRLLYQFGPDFHRLTPGALWADSRLGVRYLPLLDGCALVTNIDWIHAPGQSIATWMPCPMQVFSNEDRDDAAHWLAGLPPGAPPSIARQAKAYGGGTGGALISLVKLLIDRRFRR